MSVNLATRNKGGFDLENLFVVDKGRPACPIYLLTKQGLKDWLEDHAGKQAAWVETNHFKARRGEMLILPDKSGGIEAVLLGQGASQGASESASGRSEIDIFTIGSLSKALPSGVYRLAHDLDAEDMELAAHAWMIGTYHFDKYLPQKPDFEAPQLVLPKDCRLDRIMALGEAVFLARDLINTPAADMGPVELEMAALKLAEKFDAEIDVIAGDALVEANYPLIHAVGRAAYDAPRLIDIRWGNPEGKKLVLVGKGVCFDSGGLNLKPGAYMDLMKKDMGGAANILGLAGAVMQCGLDVNLRVLIGAVENAIGPEAFRPGDILPSRQGMTVEIGNTDAEGRLVLADMLTEAESEQPDLIIDMATLTGAARTALGPEVAPFFVRQDNVAHDLEAAVQAENDPMWRLPLWAGYDDWLSSRIADVRNISSGPHAGAITAALFLSRFVDRKTDWIHCDIYAWNPKSSPGRPVGGEAQGMRALFRMLEQRYGR